MMGHSQFFEVQQYQVSGPVLGSQEPHATHKDLGQSGCKAAQQKRPGGSGQHLAEYNPQVCSGGQEDK